jgi:hypothetical protein
LKIIESKRLSLIEKDKYLNELANSFHNQLELFISTLPKLNPPTLSELQIRDLIWKNAEWHNAYVLEHQEKIEEQNNEIDSFIKDEKFDCFSFCSLGLFSKYNNNFFKLRKNKICTFGAAQAIIYSREARTMLIKKIIDNDFGNGHMDGYYINSLDNIFTYKYPLIAQIFPATENRKEWVFFDGSFPVYILILFIKILKLDTHPHAWNLVYFFYRNIFLLLVLILLLIRSLKNVKYVKQVKYLKLVQPKNIL